MSDYPLTEGSSLHCKKPFNNRKPIAAPPPGRSVKPSAWQPIDTHPKGNDISFLVLNPWGGEPERAVHAYYHEKQLYVAFAGIRITHATHWMPMPEGSEL